MLPKESSKALIRLSRSIADEIALMEPTSDAGIVPLYSILGELIEVLKPDEVAFKEACKCLASLGYVLDNGGSPSPEFIEQIKQFHQRLDYFVRYLDTGESIQWTQLQDFWNKNEVATAEPAPTQTSPAVAAPEAVAEKPASATSKPAKAAPQEQLMVMDLADSRDVLEEFYQEAEEHLGMIEAALLDIEGDLTASEPIRSMFRSFHTIKGVASFLDLMPIRMLAHEIETLLDLIRSDKLQFTEMTINLVLESRDRLQLLVQQVGKSLASGNQPDEIIPVQDLILRAQDAIKGGDGTLSEGAAGYSGTSSDIGNVASATAPADDDEPAEATAAAGSANKKGGPSKKMNSSIRMDTDKLDSIIEAVGELVIVESQLADSTKALAGDDSSRVENNLRQLNRITRELQMSSMSLRMVSLKPLFQRMQRLARDVASKSGKKIEFRVEGEDTEMDRTVVEQIGDALVHMIRNSVDHGIESPQDRLAKGKPEVGDLLLKASYVGQNIVLELRDDGAGIYSDKILAKAKKRGLLTEGKEYSRDEILQMIFLPGFSTAEVVSDFSGRGVGMDVVRSNVQQLRGRIELSSTEGKGSSFLISLPLTMAIIDGLLVQCGEQRYVIPVSSINMTLKPSPKQVFEVQSKGQVIKHRDQIFKLVFMSELFGIESPVKKAADGIVVLIESTVCDYGLIVDKILHKQEVVIKQLGSSFTVTKGISGGAILGDGTVALILDPSAMAEKATEQAIAMPKSA